MSDDIELAVALRDRLDRAYVTVWHAGIGEAEAVLRGRARPWMVVGDRGNENEAVVSLLGRHPMLLAWRGPPPPRLPAHVRRLDLFSELASVTAAATRAEVAGVRMAPGAGLTMPDGCHASSPALEALVASHPRPLFIGLSRFRGVTEVLEAHRVPLRLARHGSSGVGLDARAA